MGLISPPSPTMAAAHRLKADCIAAKEALSSDTSTTISVMLPGLHADVRLTRSELEEMVRPLLLETVRSLQQTIRSAGLDRADVDRVLLVGGASRMPVVSELVSQALARPSFVDAHPKHVIALGAAIAAESTSTRSLSVRRRTRSPRRRAANRGGCRCPRRRTERSPRCLPHCRSPSPSSCRVGRLPRPSPHQAANLRAWNRPGGMPGGDGSSLRPRRGPWSSPRG